MGATGDVKLFMETVGFRVHNNPMDVRSMINLTLQLRTLWLREVDWFLPGHTAREIIFPNCLLRMVFAKIGQL